MGTILTVILAVTPPVLFLVWILRYDRTEPEPFGAVLRILALGCLSVIPAAFIEVSLLALPIFSAPGLIGSGLQSFLVIAPVEETAKLLVVLLFAWRSRHFTEPNDGIVYAGTASIGFAMAENLLYVFEHGAAVGIARALTSIPGHTFTGVLMGWYIGRARFSPSRRARFTDLLKGFLAAWLLHGLYDTFVLSGTPAALLVVPLVALNFIIGLRFLKKGRAHSMAKWGGPAPREPERKTGTPQRNGCRKALGRTLLALSGLFWTIVILGLLFGDTEGYDTVSVVYGSLIITFIPVTVGLIIEASIRKDRTAG